MKHLKKSIIVFCVLFSQCTVLSISFRNTFNTFTSQLKPSSQPHVVYSHGFGENGSEVSMYAPYFKGTSSAVRYPDAPGLIERAVFYTQPAVIALANHLFDQVITNKQEKVVLIGRSTGAGTAENLLALLINYDQNKSYFAGSKIRSQADADKIINAINKGGFVSTAPLLSLRKTKAVDTPSGYLAAATIAGLTAAAYYHWSSWFNKKSDTDTEDNEVAENKDEQMSDDERQELAKTEETKVANAKMHKIKNALVKLGIAGLGGAAYYVFGDSLKNIYASMGVNWIVPAFTKFDPKHIEPIDSVKTLLQSRKFTVPTLWHFNKDEDVLVNTPEDIKNMFKGAGGTEKHDVLISDDASHNTRSKQFFQKLEEFGKKVSQ